MRLRVLVGFSVGFFGAAPVQGQSPDLPARIVLSTDPRIPKPCTRTSPAAVGALFRPDSGQVLQGLAHIPTLLTRLPPDETGMTPALLDQYSLYAIGFTRESRPWIYLSFLERRLDREGKDFINWCDGGWSAFGVEYDPQADTVAAVERNHTTVIPAR